MYVAKEKFTAATDPRYDETHWVEFKAPQGAKGDTGIGQKGDTGAKGDTGTKGDKGDKGNTGNAGTGFTMKSFVLKDIYNHGDYVFSRSKLDKDHDSMWIAESKFSALKEPWEDNNKNHWVEFKAPQGAKGNTGTKGDKGDKGNTGNAGTGLTLKSFVLKDTYSHGDYVFSRSKSDKDHDSMWIAESKFSALKEPWED